MKKTLTTINDIHNYFVDLFRPRPGENHARIKHAKKVADIVFELAGLMIWRADANSIEVGTRMSQAGNRNETNMFWFEVGQQPYAMIYRNGKIALCDRNRGGAVRAELDNTSTHLQLKAAFAAL